MSKEMTKYERNQLQRFIIEGVLNGEISQSRIINGKFIITCDHLLYEATGYDYDGNIIKTEVSEDILLDHDPELERVIQLYNDGLLKNIYTSSIPIDVAMEGVEYEVFDVTVTEEGHELTRVIVGKPEEVE